MCCSPSTIQSTYCQISITKHQCNSNSIYIIIIIHELNSKAHSSCSPINALLKMVLDQIINFVFPEMISFFSLKTLLIILDSLDSSSGNLGGIYTPIGCRIWWILVRIGIGIGVGVTIVFHLFIYRYLPSSCPFIRNFQSPNFNSRINLGQ